MDELYGDDLYGDYDGYGDDGQDAYIPGQAGPSGQQVHLGADHSSKGADAEDKSKELQKRLMESLAVADRWRSAFKEVASICGYSYPSGKEPEIATVIEAVQRIKSSEGALQEEVKQLRKKEAALQIHLAERNMESIELRREVNSARQAADPNVIQLKQLLLDPALNKEFNRMKAELEETQKELKHVQEELAATSFTQESKIGRQLMAKCRSLADENEEMGRELAEGKVHQLEAQLNMAHEFADEMRTSYLEMAEHCAMLDEEAEELQREVFALRRQIKELDGTGPGPGMGQGGGMPDFVRRGDMGMGFRGGRGGRGFKRPLPPMDRDGPGMGGPPMPRMFRGGRHGPPPNR